MFPPEFLVGSRIASNVDIGSKKRLLEVLSELLAKADTTMSPETIFDRLLERERLGSTGLGHGIALPHARMKEAREAIGAFVQLRQGVDFDTADNRPVDLAFALLVPESATEMHLQLLASLAAMFDDPELRARLRAATASEALLAILTGWDGLASAT
jgi:PTS system nitrogen regulatory IIA component